MGSEGQAGQLQAASTLPKGLFKMPSAVHWKAAWRPRLPAPCSGGGAWQADAGEEAVAAISAYLSLPDCLEGVRFVLQRALGVTMAPVPFRPGAAPAAPQALACALPPAARSGPSAPALLCAPCLRGVKERSSINFLGALVLLMVRVSQQQICTAVLFQGGPGALGLCLPGMGV